jgi:hypothetical protein
MTYYLRGEPGTGTPPTWPERIRALILVALMLACFTIANTVVHDQQWVGTFTLAGAGFFIWTMGTIFENGIDTGEEEQREQPRNRPKEPTRRQ